MSMGSSSKVSGPAQQEQAIAGLSRLLAVIIVAVLLTLMNVFLYRYLKLTPGYLILLAIPILFAGFAVWVGGRFISNLYHLGSTRSGLSYLVAVLFGISYPHLDVGVEATEKKEAASVESGEEPDEGEPGSEAVTPQKKSSNKNLLLTIGGPGFVTIPSGYVVVFEGWFGKVTVRGEGKYFIPPKEWIKQIINLDEREDRIPEIYSLSKNGIRVVVKDIRYRYRICSHKPRTRQEPYPIDKDAVLRIVYDRVILKDGVEEWDASVRKTFQGIIREYISRHPADQLTAPGVKAGKPGPGLAAGSGAPYDPRQEIADRLYSADGDQRFWECGAELVWFDIGHFSIAN